MDGDVNHQADGIKPLVRKSRRHRQLLQAIDCQHVKPKYGGRLGVSVAASASKNRFRHKLRKEFTGFKSDKPGVLSAWRGFGRRRNRCFQRPQKRLGAPGSVG
jgi:hypothetical protein